MQSPILFIIFNRPEITRRVFASIRQARPSRLYVAADGPRPDRPAEAQRCSESRRIINGVDWPCEVRTLFREANLGCKLGPSSAIDWFFRHEAEGIILEDDVLPVATFFDFCDAMLALYRDDQRITAISGCNLISRHFTSASSYFFSRYNSIWGWATWRRAWRHYDVTMSAWPAWRDGGGLQRMPGGNLYFRAYWRAILDAVYVGRIDTAWDYQWSFASWHLGGLVVHPVINQITNLGFGNDATHTIAAAPEFVAESRAGPMQFPLIHPQQVAQSFEADRMIDRYVFKITPAVILRRYLSQTLRLRQFFRCAKLL